MVVLALAFMLGLYCNSALAHDFLPGGTVHNWVAANSVVTVDTTPVVQYNTYYVPSVRYTVPVTTIVVPAPRYGFRWLRRPYTYYQYNYNYNYWWQPQTIVRY